MSRFASPSGYPLAHITGVGLITPLGADASHTWEALLDGRFITDHARIDSKQRACVTRFALRAAEQAITASRNPPLQNAAIIVGTSKGPVEQWLDPQPPNPIPSSFGLSSIAADLGRQLNMCGPRLTVSTACASGLHALIRGAMMIQTREASRVLVVAAEASVHPMFIASFQRLGILPPPGFGCRPFDQDRQGFLMSEAAAAVILDSEPSEDSVAIDRFAMGADATHLTRNSDQAIPLRNCIERVVGSDPIDLIHAHGTGTDHNDATELAVLEEVFGGRGSRGDNRVGEAKPHIFSHKGALGHSLGAAGLVSVVLNVMSHRRSLIPPNIQTRNPMPAINVCLSKTPVPRPIHQSIAVAAGFGGQIAAVRLRSQ